MQTNLDRSTLIDRAEDVRTNSRNIINSISESIKPVFVGEFALVDLSGFLNKAVDNHFIWCNKGVIASRIASQYQKCCISIVSQGSYYILSCRDYYDRDVYRILSTLYNVGGHRSAFGGTLTIQEVLHLREQLEYLSCMMAKPNDITVLDYADLTNSDIINIAGENEYLHDRDIPLVRIPVESLGSQWTPPSFSERYEQFLLDVNGTVYIKKEPFANGCKFVYISFYVTNKLNGFLINYRGDLDGAI
jgi:hypothetical protein